MNIQETKQGVQAKAWTICFAACMLNLWNMRNDRISIASSSPEDNSNV
jgi:hypothetical protein